MTTFTKKIRLSKCRIGLILCLLFTGYGIYWYFFESSFYIGEPDYSKSRWRTFYGKKTSGYLPEYWTTYFTDANDPNCRESFNTTFEGKPVARKQYREFIAEESNEGKTYVIRYPDNYWIGKCEYRSYGGQFYLEEKSDDPRLKLEPYNNKSQYFRRTLVRGGNIVDFSLRSDSYLDDYDPNEERMYMNFPKYNVFCFRHSYITSFTKYQKIYGLACESYENPKKHYFHSFVFYTVSYWNNHPNIEINLKISDKTYCLMILAGQQQCVESNDVILQGDYYNWEIKKEWFNDFYDEEPTYDRP